MMFTKIVPADRADHVAQRPQDAAMASLSMLHEVACAAGGYAASPTSANSGNIALRFAAAGSLAQATVIDIAGGAERMAAAGLRALITDRAGSPSTAAAARLLAQAIAATFARIDAVLPEAPQALAA